MGAIKPQLTFAALILTAFSVQAQDQLRIVTWNIEHLGSPGRGLGGIGSGSLPKRTVRQLREIAKLIQNDLKTDLLAVQEVAITDITATAVKSKPLDTIVKALGSDWKYVLGRPPTGDAPDDDFRNIHNAFIWNSKRVRLLKSFEMTIPNERVGSKRLFDRVPLAGYFEALKSGQGTNDFVLVNVHLTSGQINDENHLAAMVIIEQNLTSRMKFLEIKESDRIVLGDFNDNPFAKKPNGDPKYIDLLYRYMEFKKYQNLVTASTGATRMDANLTSIIDHVLVNNSVRSRHLVNPAVDRFQPSDSTESGLAKWRKTFSDHFPLTLKLKVANSDDDVDF